MAQDSWPNSTHNSRNVTDAEYERMASRFSDDGVYRTAENDPDIVVAGSGLQVLVKANRYASVRGHAWTSGTTDVPLTISSNSSGSARTDAVVLRLDRSDWTVRAAVREGTPGAGAPSLVRQESDTGLWEVLLAYVTVPNNATSVTVNNRPQYVGSRVRAEDQGKANPNPALGEIAYRPNTGEYRGYVGNGQYVTLYSDTGDLPVSLGFSNVWEAVGPMTVRKINGVVSCQINVRRIGITFSDGDEDGSHVATVPPTVRPVRDEFFPCYFTGDTPARMDVRTNGQLWVTHPQNNVTAGRYLRLTMTWLRP